MTVQEIKTAVDQGNKVHWMNFAYTVVKSKSDYLIKHSNGSCIGLTYADAVTLNGKEQEFFMIAIEDYQGYQLHINRVEENPNGQKTQTVLVYKDNKFITSSYADIQFENAVSKAKTYIDKL